MGFKEMCVHVLLGLRYPTQQMSSMHSTTSYLLDLRIKYIFACRVVSLCETKCWIAKLHDYRNILNRSLGILNGLRHRQVELQEELCRGNFQPRSANIFQAEALTILDACRRLGHNPSLKRDIVILIDSQAAIEPLYSVVTYSTLLVLGYWKLKVNEELGEYLLLVKSKRICLPITRSIAKAKLTMSDEFRYRISHHGRTCG